MLKTSYFSLLIGILLVGCATDNPFTPPQIIGGPNASRISITSINEANYFDRTSVLPGKVYLNGVYQGDFTKSSRTFTAELQEGSNLIVVCPERDTKCINVQLKVEPRKHYKYKYVNEVDYKVVWANFIWRLVPLEVTDYEPASATTSRSQVRDTAPSSGKASTKTSPNALNEMEAARIKCLELGFKVDTESFGACILKISSQL